VDADIREHTTEILKQCAGMSAMRDAEVALNPDALLLAAYLNFTRGRRDDALATTEVGLAP